MSNPKIGFPFQENYSESDNCSSNITKTFASEKNEVIFWNFRYPYLKLKNHTLFVEYKIKKK